MRRAVPTLASAAASHPGRARESNEDLFLCQPQAGIYAVIDGVGGEEGGEEAARIASGILQSRLSHPTATVAQRLSEAITLANNEIFKRARATPGRAHMSCVLTAAVVDGERLAWGHVGDSRLYLLRRGEIRQLTTDHSPVGDLERRGSLSEIEAMRHPRRSEIFRDVGSATHGLDDREFVELGEIALPADAAFLLCSDGLSDQVPQAAILRLVEDHASDPRRAVDRLIDAANQAGGKDNVTVVLGVGSGFARPQAAPRPTSSPARRTGRMRRVATTAAGLGLVAALGFSVPALLEAWQSFSFASTTPATLRVGPGESFGSLSAALAAAKAGDTVRVEPGTYTEAVELKSGVRLVSRASRQAVLAPQAEIAVLAQGIVGASLEGFLILGQPGQGLAVGLAIRDSSLIVRDVEIAGTSLAALDIDGDGSSTFTGCLLRDNPGSAVRVGGRHTQHFERNWFRGNGSATVPVVAISAGSFPRFDNNDFVANFGLALRGLDATAVAETFERNHFGGLPAARAIEPRGPSP